MDTLTTHPIRDMVKEMQRHIWYICESEDGLEYKVKACDSITSDDLERFTGEMVAAKHGMPSCEHCSDAAKAFVAMDMLETMVGTTE